MDETGEQGASDRDAGVGGDRGSGTPAPPAAQLLLTILGDYWFAGTEHIPSAALVAVMGEFGVGDDAVRAALSRLCRDGRLERHRDGRRTSYRLAETARASAVEGARRLMRFGAGPVPWDGLWTCVAFSVPETDRRRRASLRHRLRALGMGPLFDGVWVSPRPILDEIGHVLDDLGIDGATVLRASEVARPSGVSLLQAWDLPDLRGRIDSLAAALRAVDGRLGRGGVGPAEALVARTDLMARWRALAAGDPHLPDEVLPPDWPLRPTRALFVAVYDALGPLSELRVRQLVGAGAGGGPRHHPLADLA